MEQDTKIYTTSCRSFWGRTASSMLLVTTFIALFKVGFTLLYCSFNGYSTELKFWWGVVPYFRLGLPQERFTRVVTLSAWFSIVGALVGIAVSYLRSRRYVKQTTKVLTSAELPKTWSFFTDSGRRGYIVGATVGSLAVFFTTLFEVLRDRLLDTYIWPLPHLFTFSVGAIPFLVLLYLRFRSYWSQYTMLSDL